MPGGNPAEQRRHRRVKRGLAGGDGVAAIGDRLRQARSQTGCSQRDLASTVGVSASAVAQWELSQSVPTLAKLTAVANALAVSVDWLLGRASAAATGEHGRDGAIPPRDWRLLAEARALGVDLDEVVAEARRRRWLQENRDALQDANRFLEKYGLWSDGRRQF